MFQHGCGSGQLVRHLGAAEFVACLLELEKTGAGLPGVGQRSAPGGAEGEPDHRVVSGAGSA